MTVRDRIAQERARLRGLTLAAGAGAAVAVTALLLAVAVYLLAGARWIELPAALPLAIWLAVAGVVGAAVWLTARLARRGTDERAVAEAVEREQRLRSGALRGVLEVAGSGALARRAEERLNAQLATAPGALAPELRRRTARRGGAAATVGMLGVGALAFSAADAPDGWTVLAHPISAMTGSLLPALHVVDAPPAVMRGEPLELAVAAPGRRSVLVRHRATGGAWVTERLPVTDGRAVLRVSRMEADLTVIASDGRASSDSVLVPVTDRPFLGNVSVTATFPAYLRRQPETLPLGEPARVPQGTELRVQGSSTTELRHVLLAPEGAGDTLRLAVDGRGFSGRIVATQSGRWSFAALGTRGDVPHVPPPLELQVTPDSAPRVLILTPGRDTLVLPTSSVSLTLAASDDHGLGDVVLRAWRQRAGGEAEAERSTRLEPAGQPEWSGGAQIALAGYELQPGDEVHVIATATDQSPWRQSASSRELVLRVATLAEQRTNVRETADSVIARALAAAAAQRSLAQRTEDASRSRDRGNSSSQRSGEGNGEQGGTAMSFESAERAKALANEQRQLQQQVEQTREAAQNLEEQLKQAGAMDEELQQRMREVQQMLRDALTPQMAEQLRKLEESAQRLNPEQTRQALGDLAQQQKAMREQLERSVEMLKRAALEGAMETLRDEAKDLSDAQQQLADSLRRQPGEQQRGAQQQGAQQQGAQQDARQRGEQQSAQGQPSQPQPSSAELARRTEELAREVQELQQRLAQQKADAGAKRAAEAARHSDASADAMRQAAKQQGGEQQGGEERSGQQQAGQQGTPQPQPGAQQQGAQQQLAKQGTQQGAQPQAGEQKAGQQQGQSGQQGQQGKQGEGQQERPGGRPQDGGQQGGGSGGAGAQSAQQAADEMRKASEQLAQARQDQVNEWKQDLSAELDRSISELQQLAREQQQLEQQARGGASSEELRGQQSAVQQGVQQTNQRLQEAGKSSSLLSQRSQQMVAQAQKQVQQASQAAGQSKSAQQVAPQMRSAADALNQAAGSLARDRARVNSAQSASGFAEQMEEMQKLAQQQGALSQDAAGMLPGPGTGQPNAAAQEQARRLSQQQRAIAEQLGQMSDKDGSGRTDALAAEAERLAQQLAGGALDQDMVNRQQRLFRRMLDAGRTLEKDEIDESGKREAESARAGQLFTPSEGTAAGRSAQRFRLPTWNELRELSPEERRLVLEYFRRLNAEAGAAPPAPAPAAPPPRAP